PPTGRWAIAALAVHPGGVVRTAIAERASGARHGLGLDAAPIARANQHEVRFELGEDALLEVEVRGERRWPRRALGGSGAAQLVPGLPQYWHPHLLGGRGRGVLELDGQRSDRGDASVFAEE